MNDSLTLQKNLEKKRWCLSDDDRQDESQQDHLPKAKEAYKTTNQTTACSQAWKSRQNICKNKSNAGIDIRWLFFSYISLQDILFISLPQWRLLSQRHKKEQNEIQG